MFYFNVVTAKLKKAFQCEYVRRVYFTIIIFAAWLVGLIAYQSSNSFWQAMAAGSVAAIYGVAIVTLKRFDEDTLDILPFAKEEMDDEESECSYISYVTEDTEEIEETEEDNLDKIDRIAQDELFEIRRLSNAKPQLKQAIDDIRRLSKIRETIKRLDDVIYKKALMAVVKGTYNNLRIYVLQNIRGITAICIAGQALDDNKLSDEDIAKIEEQLANNRVAFESFKKLLKEVPNGFRTAADTAVQLDIESSITAIRNFNATSNTDAH